MIDHHIIQEEAKEVRELEEVTLVLRRSDARAVLRALEEAATCWRWIQGPDSEGAAYYDVLGQLIEAQIKEGSGPAGTSKDTDGETEPGKILPWRPKRRE